MSPNFKGEEKTNSKRRHIDTESTIHSTPSRVQSEVGLHNESSVKTRHQPRHSPQPLYNQAEDRDGEGLSHKNPSDETENTGIKDVNLILVCSLQYHRVVPPPTTK